FHAASGLPAYRHFCREYHWHTASSCRKMTLCDIRTALMCSCSELVTPADLASAGRASIVGAGAGNAIWNEDEASKQPCRDRDRWRPRWVSRPLALASASADERTPETGTSRAGRLGERRTRERSRRRCRQRNLER